MIRWRLWMRKGLLLVLAALLVLPATVRAQGSINLETLNVRLLSEYDEPSMLVIVDFAVPSDTVLPTKVELRVPDSANITAVAYLSEDQLLNAEFAGPETDGT